MKMGLLGKKIEEFEVDAFQKENGFIKVSLEKDFLGKWSIVLFYPADFTFVCPTELEDLQNQYSELKNLGAGIRCFYRYALYSQSLA
jgi:peroxiredoxin (alkyl hydroperoxide reductase subunit C)